MFTEKNVLHAVPKTGRSFLVFVDHLGPLSSQDNIFFIGPVRNTAIIIEYCKSVLQPKVLWFSIKIRNFKEPVHFRLFNLLQITSFTLLMSWSIFPEDVVTRGAVWRCSQIVQSVAKPHAGSLSPGTESHPSSPSSLSSSVGTKHVVKTS